MRLMKGSNNRKTRFEANFGEVFYFINKQKWATNRWCRLKTSNSSAHRTHIVLGNVYYLLKSWNDSRTLIQSGCQKQRQTNYAANLSATLRVWKICKHQSLSDNCKSPKSTCRLWVSEFNVAFSYVHVCMSATTANNWLLSLSHSAYKLSRCVKSVYIN